MTWSIEEAETCGWDIVPTISCGASPSAHVTKDAFERIVTEMIDGIAGAGPLDAVYLDLHGAMVTEHYDDGEGEILARARKVVDVASFYVTPGLVDLHVHVYEGASHYGIEVDSTCLQTGATTVLDLGSAGAWTFSGFPCGCSGYDIMNRPSTRRRVLARSRAI